MAAIAPSLHVPVGMLKILTPLSEELVTKTSVPPLIEVQVGAISGSDRAFFCENTGTYVNGAFVTTSKNSVFQRYRPHTHNTHHGVPAVLHGIKDEGPQVGPELSGVWVASQGLDDSASDKDEPGVLQDGHAVAPQGQGHVGKWAKGPAAVTRLHHHPGRERSCRAGLLNHTPVLHGEGGGILKKTKNKS